MPQEFRLQHRIDLPPSFMSLGLPPVAFKDGSDPTMTAFDAVICGPTDTLMLFKGEDVLTYNLREDSIVHDPLPLTEVFGASALPGEFSLGIDSACWAGPSFPNIFFLFRGSEFIRLEAASPDAEPNQWQLTLGPIATRREFLRIPNPAGGGVGIPFGPATQLHGLRDDAAHLHFFSRDGNYARHNLMNGEIDIQPTPTESMFGLPAEFGGRVDLAFYGAGASAERMFLISGFRYAEFDVRTKRIRHHGVIEERFPQLSLFIARPQLFLIEEYSLQSFLGPIEQGGLADISQISAESISTRVLVTQITTASEKTLRQNVVETQALAAQRDFITKVETAKQSETDTESFQHRLNAMFHGEAQAKGFWGGEVSAELAVEGSTDEQRKKTAKQASQAITSQLSETTQSVKSRALQEEDANKVVENVFRKETYEVKNSTKFLRETRFFFMNEKYVTVFALTGVKGAYTDGMRRPRVFSLPEFERELETVLSDQAQVAPTLAFIRKELERIENSTGEMEAIVRTDIGTLALKGRIETEFMFPNTDPPQKLKIFGIVKEVNEHLRPTYETTGVQMPPPEVPEIVSDIVAPVGVEA
jgi:hypothetical protein